MIRVRHILLAMFIAWAASSCGRLSADASFYPIGFGVGGTKAVVTGVEQMKADGVGFTVLGASSPGEEFNPSEGSVLFDNQNITYSTSSGGWTYSPVHYWTGGRTYRFCAYWPSRAGCTISGDLVNSVSLNGFVQPGQMTAQHDLMVSGTSSRIVPSPVVSRPAPVNLAFRHLLCNVRVAVTKTPGTTADITVTGISFTKIRNRATFAMTSSDGGNTWNSGTWSPEPGLVTFDSGSVSQVVSVFDEDDADASYSQVIGSGFLFIPQKVNPEGTPDSEMSYLIVEYTSGENSKRASVKMPQNTVWEVNRVITYRLKIDENYDITFGRPSVDPWGNAQASGTIIIK